ncbi:FkbM family methyltransferase [Jiella sp. M17.18]|uniref:FkbM family methyltransferase n=1 Tax=Jiella sp. M17.18 TaxID=3234247 RepID=UPI0034DF9E9B
MTFVSYAQNFEDVILYRALKHVWNGTYVDVGACDPTQDSVTKAFYDRGWSGFNLEPVEEFHRRLSEERPRDRNILAAAGDVAGELPCYVIDETGLSTLDPEIAKTHRAAGRQIRETTVPVVTLRDLLKEFSDRPIHFLKIDVEGFEDNVLAGTDLEAVRPWILVIEATLPSQDTPTHEKWEPRVLANGYRFAFFDGVSRYYVAEEHADLIDRLARPANVFDGYETAYTVDLRNALTNAHESYDELLRQIERERQDAAAHAMALERQLEQERRDAAAHAMALERQLEQERRDAAANAEVLEQEIVDRQNRLDEQKKAAAAEEHRLHAVLQQVRDHLATMERSRGWRLVVFLRRPLNLARRIKRRIFGRLFGQPGVGALPPVSLQSELNFAAKELARRVVLKASLRKR